MRLWTCLGLLTSVKPLWKHHYWHAQRYISYVILGPARLAILTTTQGYVNVSSLELGSVKVIKFRWGPKRIWCVLINRVGREGGTGHRDGRVRGKRPYEHESRNQRKIYKPRHYQQITEAGRGREAVCSVFVRKRYLYRSRNQPTEALISSDLQSPELLHRESCPSSHPGSATSLE